MTVSENQIVISGFFTKQPEKKTINTERGELKLCEANLEYVTMRGGEKKRMWVDVEATSEMCDTLASFSDHQPVRVEGELLRAAWKSKLTDQWMNKHVIRLKAISEASGSVPATDSQAPAYDDSDIPF